MRSGLDPHDPGSWCDIVHVQQPGPTLFFSCATVMKCILWHDIREIKWSVYVGLYVQYVYNICIYSMLVKKGIFIFKD